MTPHRSDADLLKEVIALPEKRGISDKQFNGCLRYLTRFPEQAEVVVAAIMRHAPVLGVASFARLGQILSKERPDLIDTLISLVPATPKGFQMLCKVGVQQTNQPQMYMACRAKIENTADVDEYDAKCSRPALIHIFYSPDRQDADKLLRAVLSQPGAANKTVDFRGQRLSWIVALTAQSIVQNPSTELLSETLSVLHEHGVQINPTEGPCEGLVFLARNKDHIYYKEKIATVLLDHGARWQGIEAFLDDSNDDDKTILDVILYHPRVRSERLAMIAQEQQGGVHKESKRPTL